MKNYSKIHGEELDDGWGLLPRIVHALLAGMEVPQTGPPSAEYSRDPGSSSMRHPPNSGLIIHKTDGVGYLDSFWGTPSWIHISDSTKNTLKVPNPPSILCTE